MISTSIERPLRTGGGRLLLNVAAQDHRRSERTASLRSAGYTVVEAASESQAISTVIHSDVAVVVIDGDLPQCNLAALGETLRRMRPAMAVVPLSTTGQARVQWPGDDFSAAGIDDRQLIAAVAHALRRSAGEGVSNPDVVTDLCGRIRDVSSQGARLLNVTPRGLFQRNLVTFFDAGREIWQDAVRRASAGESVELTGRLRPKERRPVSVSVRIISRTGAAGISLEWSIAPLPHSLAPADPQQ